MKDIVIIGAGGFGREVAWLIEEINKEKKEWNIIGFVDDNVNLQGKYINGYNVVGNIDWLSKQNLYATCAIGEPSTKKMTIDRLQGSDVRYPILIHPNVVYSNTVTFGEGSIICAGNILTVNIDIGKHVIINLDCTAGHDVKIGDFSTILPSVNISGEVSIGECVNIGTGTAIIQRLNICKNVTIGAGAAVVKDITEPGTYVGVPARKIERAWKVEGTNE